jgi:hypothetical protein
MITTPTMKIKNARNIMKGEKTDENPAVSLPSTIREIPTPTLSPNSRRKTVDATHNVKPSTVKVV